MTSAAYGMLSIGLFYVITVFVGVFAARRRKRQIRGQGGEVEMELAGRSIGTFVGMFTLTASWLGGGSIFGIVEKIYSEGLLNCYMPLCYSLSLIIGGAVFAHKMRSKNYVTMLEPFREKYGERTCGLFLLPILPTIMLHMSALLVALGKTVSLVVNINLVLAIVMSAITVLIYTMFGGFIAVAYTDIIQLVFLLIGTVITLPFVLNNPSCVIVFNSSAPWIGSVDKHDWIVNADSFLMLTLGTIMCQGYFQRVLSSKTARTAVITSCVSGLVYLVLIAPIVLLGIAAKSTDWSATSHGEEITPEQYSSLYSFVLLYLTPNAIRYIGTGVIAAAVMSTADSLLLAGATLILRDMWKPVIRPNASRNESKWVTRISMIALSVIPSIIASSTDSIYGLVSTASELTYCVTFSEFVCVLFVPFANTYGALAGFTVGTSLRLMCGFTELGIPALIKFPGFDETSNKQRFPFKTMMMLVTVTTIVVVSAMVRSLFIVVNSKYDFLHCFSKKEDTTEMDQSNDDTENRDIQVST